MSVICIKTISELKEMSFIIPSYQRGYRWKDIQVEQLLNDLWEFYQDNKAKPDAWYCLQPLVVKNVEDKASTTDADNRNVLPCGHVISPADETGATWTVIDGQQRLTTLFLVLSQLGGDNIKPIEYETRKGSEKFLVDLTSNPEADKVDSNPDYYYIKDAVATIINWLIKHPGIDKRDFSQTILNQAKFIWYETTENHYDVFIRLNSGKISLSNAELIKALLLRENRFSDKDGTVKLQQLEIASEWDRIEQTLGNDEFWYFINPDAESPRFNATRIDFLFELVLRKGVFEDNKALEKIELIGPVTNFIDELGKNPYFAFATFADLCKTPASNNPEKLIWSEIQSVFRWIKSWHDDRSLYHMVGFLINQKGVKKAETRIKSLVDLLNNSDKMSHPAFKKDLTQKCGATIKGGKKFDELDYNSGSDKAKLNDVLLLFNLALLDRQDSEQSRYPFHLHVKQKWSLEHIHAKNERELKAEERKELAKDLSCNVNAPIEELNLRLKEAFGENNVSIEERKIGDDSNNTTALFLLCDQQDTHGLENLALLEHGQNSTFGNKFYPEKRRVLYHWENGGSAENLPAFIPLGTRMVFFKHFSPHNSAPFVWDSNDSDTYFNTIVNLVATYTGVNEKKLISQTMPTNNGENHD